MPIMSLTKNLLINIISGIAGLYGSSSETQPAYQWINAISFSKYTERSV